MEIQKHQFLANLNSFYNRSVAEMTMYPSEPNENLMFMYTWPDVRTLYSGIYLEDNFEINCHSNLKFTTNLGFHNNNVAVISVCKVYRFSIQKWKLQNLDS